MIHFHETLELFETISKFIPNKPASWLLAKTLFLVGLMGHAVLPGPDSEALGAVLALAIFTATESNFLGPKGVGLGVMVEVGPQPKAQPSIQIFLSPW